MASLLSKYHLVIGFDTEYVQARVFDDELPDKENAVVSYQFAVLDTETRKRDSTMLKTRGHTKNHRLSLPRLLGDVLNAAIAEGIAGPAVKRAIRDGKIKILLVGHFTRADLPAFRDFKRLKRLFDGLRKTYATTLHPAVFILNLGEGRHIRASATLLDTQLLVPAGSKSLRHVGELMGHPKLTIPDVVTEDSSSVPAIERMDLAIRQHPDDFRDYATRDAEIAVTWLERVIELADQWGLPKLSPTIGSMATQLFSKLAFQNDHDLHDLLGTMPVAGRRKPEPRPEYLHHQSFLASCFHGARNEAYGVGLFEGEITDWDLAGAYTTAMAQFRGFDWERIEVTTDLDRLAQLDIASFAHVRFEFPASTLLPSLPVSAGEHGLLYPLAGESYCTGPELVVARLQGALISVLEGLIIPWKEPDGPRPFVAFTRHINMERARFGKGSLMEQLAKETGNSLYGKTAQGVAHMRPVGIDDVGGKTTFDTRNGNTVPIPPSLITQPAIAAMTTGLLRAVLSEILARLLDDVLVLSATTDGWLSSANADQVHAATQGPVCRYFAKLRAMVSPDGSDVIVEKKHDATAVIVMKTRGAVTVGATSQPILARAGHRLDGDFACPEDEARAFIELYRTRTYDSKTTRRSFVSIRTQWIENADLYNTDTETAVNLCYDMKRQPVGVADHDGMIRFTTKPWRDRAAFKENRHSFDAWRKVAHATLSTAADWDRFQTYRVAGYSGTDTIRTPFQNAVLTAWVTGQSNLPTGKGRGRPRRGEWTASRITEFLTEAGVPGVTRKVIRGKKDDVPDFNPAHLTATDWQLLAAIAKTIFAGKDEPVLRLGTQSIHFRNNEG